MFNNRSQSTPAETSTQRRTASQELKATVHSRLIENMDLTQARQMPQEQLYQECSRRVDQLLNEQRSPLSAPEKQKLLQEVMDEIFGLGPIEELLRDPRITDILVNGPRQIYIEREGRLEPCDLEFRNDGHVVQVIQRIAAGVGRRIDESSPMLDARLADGSRVNAIIAPLAIDGPAMSIRRFGTVPFDVSQLIKIGSMTTEMAVFLEACVRCRLNVLISGGTGSGKTTLLNVCSKWIPAGERVITIEDAAELQLQQEHVLRLETKTAGIEGRGATTVRDLVRNALRMRPDRIIVGECRGGEALDMLQAMNTGHDGSLTTLHANSPRDALARLETLVLMAGVDLPLRVVRQQIASAVDLIVQESRLKDGTRRVTAITEVAGMEGDVVVLTDIFKFEQSGVDPDGKVLGELKATGIRPLFSPRLEAAGLNLKAAIFGSTITEMINSRQRR